MGRVVDHFALVRVLIIGCGYVGIQAGAELVRLGHAVSGLRRQAGHMPDLVAAGISPLNGDITDAASLAGLSPDFDWVVNCVASTSGGGPEEYRRVYLEGTRKICHWLAGAPIRKYVYTSSTGVYGQNDGSWVDESCPAEPASATGKVLAEAEGILRCAHRDTDFPAVILRVAGIYGPGRGYYLRQLQSGEARIEGSGRRFINMVHRDDVAGAILAALEKGRPGQIYNVCDEEPVSQVELYGWLAGRLGPARASGRVGGRGGSGQTRGDKQTHQQSQAAGGIGLSVPLPYLPGGIWAGINPKTELPKTDPLRQCDSAARRRPKFVSLNRELRGPQGRKPPPIQISFVVNRDWIQLGESSCVGRKAALAAY